MCLLFVFNRHLSPFASIQLLLYLSRSCTHTQHTTHNNNNKTRNNIIISEIDWSGRVVVVVGIGIGDRGRSCEEHEICGCILYPDVLVRFIKEEIMVEGRIEVVITVYWVTDSIERCRVVFLPRYLVPSSDSLDGVLAQVTEAFDECIHPRASGKRCTTIMDIATQQSFHPSQAFDFIDGVGVDFCLFIINYLYYECVIIIMLL
jgi:hypothetical protein